MNTHKPITPIYEDGRWIELGLTKREHFAGMALAGMLGNAGASWEIETLAEDAVKFADALIETLTATTEKENA